MKKALQKLNQLMRKNYDITDMFYYWSEKEESFARVLLFDKEENLEEIEASGKEAIKLINRANEILKKGK
ncbi:MAG: hypothetical protein NWF08_04115 [Candidatus Bathyarchaeota archaeon]|nr:hypothetical protein [Candidatus Bathyarchaeota archaeon]